MTRIFFIVKIWWLPVFIFWDLRHTTRRSSMFNILIFVDILVTKTIFQSQAANIQYSYCWAPTEIGTQLCGLHCSRQNQSLAPKQRTFKIATAGRRRYLLLICVEYKFAAKSIPLSLPSCEHQIVLLLECAPFGNTLVPKVALPNRGYTLPTHDRSPQESSFNRRRSGRRAINCIHGSGYLSQLTRYKTI